MRREMVNFVLKNRFRRRPERAGQMTPRAVLQVAGPRRLARQSDATLQPGTKQICENN